MGNTVYESTIPVEMSSHVFAHSRAEGKDGIAYLVINNSKTNNTIVELSCEAKIYSLSCKNNNLCSRTMLLNDKKLFSNGNNDLPKMKPVKVKDQLEIKPGGCAFILI
mgnify:CR=1 FL=1